MKSSSTLLVPAVLLLLTGCWTPPNANVQPAGPPGLIQAGIQVVSDKDPAAVTAVEVNARTITLKGPDQTTVTYKVGTSVKNLGQVQPGDQAAVTVTEELAIYILENGRGPDGATAESLGVNAKVLLVDPSYRILTVQYPNGQSEAFKPGLGTLMERMAPGDSVVVKPLEVTKIRIEKP